MVSSESGSNATRSLPRDGRRLDTGPAFRPVALPALAAAVHAATAGKVSPAIAAGRIRVFVHEDEPQD